LPVSGHQAYSAPIEAELCNSGGAYENSGRGFTINHTVNYQFMSYYRGKNIRSWMMFILIGVLFVVLYFNTLSKLIDLWSTNEDYGHGFFVIPIILYLLWKKAEEFSPEPYEPARWGTALVAIWALLYSLGSVGQIATITYASMIVFPIAAVATLINAKTSLAILAPAGFMIFMFPVPSEVYTRVTNPLLLMSTTISFQVLDILQIPVLRDGNVLTLPNYTMEVVQACSGIRSLMSIMALAFIMAYLMIKSNVFRAAFFLMSIPVAIIGNILRISITALLAYYISPKAAEGFSHILAGIVVFMFSCLLLFFCLELILWLSKKREPSFSP
jgi:exosortase